MNENTRQIIALANGERSSKEIAEIVGISARYVRKLLLRKDLPRINEGGRAGSKNHQFVSGRRVDMDGYVLVTAPQNHPHARNRTNRQTKLMFEHRLVLEQKIGRYLLPGEVADHIDGLTLHNHPSNLRVFPTNADHLHETLSGRVPNWSTQGKKNIQQRHRLPVNHQPVNNYRLRRERGEIRLQQILLAALQLGIDSPFLSGTNHHTSKAQIDMSSRSTIKRALDDLYRRWGWGQTP